MEKRLNEQAEATRTMNETLNKFLAVMANQEVARNVTPVRGHPSISLLPLSSPTPHLFICIPSPHLCTIFKDHTSSRSLLGPIVRRLSRSQLTNNCRLPTSAPARTSTASDRLRTHWGDAMAPSAIMWTTIYGRLGTRRLGTAFLCILL
jgi:hypothetical protein